MIQRFLIYLFGVNYQTTLGVILTVISAIPNAITLIMKLYEGQIIFPAWVTIVSAICMFISIIYTGITAKSKNTTGINGSAKTMVDGRLMTKNEITGK
jgi:hypothetical protein